MTQLLRQLGTDVLIVVVRWMIYLFSILEKPPETKFVYVKTETTVTLSRRVGGRPMKPSRKTAVFNGIGIPYLHPEMQVFTREEA